MAVASTQTRDRSLPAPSCWWACPWGPGVLAPFPRGDLLPWLPLAQPPCLPHPRWAALWGGGGPVCTPPPAPPPAPAFPEGPGPEFSPRRGWLPWENAGHFPRPFREAPQQDRSGNSLGGCGSPAHQVPQSRGGATRPAGRSPGPPVPAKG